MAIKIGYMGTKKFMAPHVLEVINSCADGPVLDVFAGMGAVGEALADRRPLWVNDAQIFASEVGRAIFTSNKNKHLAQQLKSQLSEAFLWNREKLKKRFSPLLIQERDALAVGSLNRLNKVRADTDSLLSRKYVHDERRRLALSPKTVPYRLFSLTYAGGFFSLNQAIDIDSLRYAIDVVCFERKMRDKKRWLLVALGVTLLRLSSSTGHFAQYLQPNANNLNFVLTQKRRNVCDVFFSELDCLEPVGSTAWRKKNRVFNCDANALLERMWLFNDRPSVVYADPPYTDDQYSRYYHLWETLMLYDYPESHGKGCYRPDRFQTPFAKKTKVESAVNDLAMAVSRAGADLVLSYPANGLLYSVASSVEVIVRRHFRTCQRVKQISHKHSTMGASNGEAKRSVSEMIFVARN